MKNDIITTRKNNNFCSVLPQPIHLIFESSQKDEQLWICCLETDRSKKHKKWNSWNGCLTSCCLHLLILLPSAHQFISLNGTLFSLPFFSFSRVIQRSFYSLLVFCVLFVFVSCDVRSFKCTYHVFSSLIIVTHPSPISSSHVSQQVRAPSGFWP